MTRKKVSKEILRQVVQEITDHLAQIEAILLRLGESPPQAEEIQELFRLMHTIKGVVGVLDRPEMVEAAHRAENVLAAYREQSKNWDVQDLDFLFQTKDLLSRALQGESVDMTALGGASPKGLPHPATQEKTPASAAAEGELAEEDETESVFLLFRVRGSLCGFPVEQIREVSQILPWREIPFAKDSFCGMTSLRGQLVPVLDPASLLRIEQAREEGGRILFLEASEELVGVYVDRVLGVYALPGWKDSESAVRHFGFRLVDAVASFREETVAILSPDRLVETASA